MITHAPLYRDMIIHVYNSVFTVQKLRALNSILYVSYVPYYTHTV